MANFLSKNDTRAVYQETPEEKIVIHLRYLQEAREQDGRYYLTTVMTGNDKAERRNTHLQRAYERLDTWLPDHYSPHANKRVLGFRRGNLAATDML